MKIYCNRNDPNNKPKQSHIWEIKVQSKRQHFKFNVIIQPQNLCSIDIHCMCSVEHVSGLFPAFAQWESTEENELHSLGHRKSYSRDKGCCFCPPLVLSLTLSGAKEAFCTILLTPSWLTSNPFSLNGKAAFQCREINFFQQPSVVKGSKVCLDVIPLSPSTGC